MGNREPQTGTGSIADKAKNPFAASRTATINRDSGEKTMFTFIAVGLVVASLISSLLVYCVVKVGSDAEKAFYVAPGIREETDVVEE